MNLEESIARVLCPRFPIGADGIDFGDGAPRLLPGGFCVFRVALPAALDALAELRGGGTFPYVCSDLERGAGQQVPGMTRLAPPIAIGASGDVGLAREAGRLTAIEARSLGIAVVFAPVLDVADHGANPIVASRAFSDDAATVSRFGRTWIEGCTEGGARATAKHYPGHGATLEDSHLTLPVLDRRLAALEAIDEPPFRAAIDAGVPAMMVGHLAALDIDPDGRPASLSRNVITERLRGRLGFRGVVFTDALDMAAIAPGDADPGSDPAVRVLAAGADVPLLTADPSRAARAIRDAVQAGLLAETRVRDAATRVTQLVTGVDVAARPSYRPHAGGADLARRIARAAVVPLGDRAIENAPLRGDVDVVLIDDANAVERYESFLRLLRARDVAPSSAEASSDRRRLVVVFSDVRSSKGRVRLPEPLARRARSLLRPGDVLLSAGPPQAASDLYDHPTIVFVMDQDDPSLEAAADALTGRLRPTGRRTFRGLH